MKLTTKGRYAVTAMLDLALHDTHGSVTLADIAKRQEISLAYLEQLFAKLKRGGLVDSTRGPGGGYRLKKPAGEISVADVINAVDEPVDATRCGGQQNCQGDLRCLTHDLWAELNDQISTFLKSVTLGELVQRKNVKVVSARQDVDASCTFKLMKRMDKNASVH
jgi:Rrf2 family iron-sulfur cluster assembly transcriptional regulator